MRCGCVYYAPGAASRGRRGSPGHVVHAAAPGNGGRPSGVGPALQFANSGYGLGRHPRRHYRAGFTASGAGGSVPRSALRRPSRRLTEVSRPSVTTAMARDAASRNFWSRVSSKSTRCFEQNSRTSNYAEGEV